MRPSVPLAAGVPCQAEVFDDGSIMLKQHFGGDRLYLIGIFTDLDAVISMLDEADCLADLKIINDA